MSDKVRETSSKAALKEMKEDYLRMLEESFQNTAEIKKGDVVEAPVVSITDNFLILNLGGKFDAYAEISEYSDEKGKLTLAVGDTLKGYVVDQNDQGFVVGKSLTKQHVDKQSIRDAYEKKIPVQGKVYSVTKGGFNVDILGARAFCPVSQISARPVDDTTKFIGQILDFIVIECSENCRRLVVSHRQLAEQEALEKKIEVLSKLNEGDVVPGKVMRMTSFGAFIDIGGVEGLMHVSEISWQHVIKPQDVLKTGQELDVKILSIKEDKVALSLKALQDNPFISVMSEMKEGDEINCRVLRLHNFGAFAELKPGVEGLIPISEMSRNRNIAHPREILKEGDYVQVQILRIDSDTQKISLSLKALQPDPWEKISEIIKLEEPFEGVVESSTNFGVFVTVADGITGLLPRSRMRMSDNFNSGDKVKLMVTAIDRENHRITLDYTDRTPEEIAAASRPRTQQDRSPRESGARDSYRDRDSFGGRRGGRRDEEWRKYAVEKNPIVEDNPFKDL
ncbi:MAG: S1 RNA-binding domain-containing protein [Candidatus Cloacimonadaceae bacterium]|jgi:small subunit ribosomal protein S1|nr:S1 RNA-binding domain-containing protein [Candidatus Cloacimonadota bacterium]MDY0127468.1 S1 RNA-binding domain-containing protein [Candidatus Cloacimonadaceae bacterium]MCB5254828.1 S1 RNA-binding domain-containing protein [Candidatus Cloacimonadota bacterium]MCK9178917.1 S1 RNA-binding domain-containing protein [Candidatus Cloacimonadota bacterium]MCK9243443.1 S1 RNA-binding domain-containing protein [Candidatus Cloacimonadota bacterium]